MNSIQSTGVSNAPTIRSSLSKAFNPNENDTGNDSGKHESEMQKNNDNENDNDNDNENDNSEPQDRKRRDNMNEKIQELLKLIPQTFFNNSSEKNSGTKDGKPNKGQILSKSVDYINYLQGEIDSKNRKEVELSIKLRNLEIEKGVPIDKRIDLTHTSAEVGLGKIGVGPLSEE